MKEDCQSLARAEAGVAVIHEDGTLGGAGQVWAVHYEFSFGDVEFELSIIYPIRSNNSNTEHLHV